MKQILLSFILFFSISSFALSLSQVRADLKMSALAQDSIEMSIRTTVNSSAGKETKVTTEILALRSSKKFPDKLFEF